MPLVLEMNSCKDLFSILSFPRVGITSYRGATQDDRFLPLFTQDESPSKIGRNSLLLSTFLLSSSKYNNHLCRVPYPYETNNIS
jgi:hypothetical protein